VTSIAKRAAVQIMVDAHLLGILEALIELVSHPRRAPMGVWHQHAQIPVAAEHLELRQRKFSTLRQT
jgi:hypothetical protein